MFEVPKLLLQQSVTIYKKIGTDKWGESIYDDGIKVGNVRVDTETTFIGSRNDRKIVKTDILFIYRSTQPKGLKFDDSFLEAKVVDQWSNESLVKKIIPVHEPNNTRIYGYELELG
nr:MAG TPA: Minor capsid protein [Caudoviricetes sp.]